MNYEETNYIELLMFWILICGTCGFYGLVSAWYARQRNQGPVKGFLLGVLFCLLFPFAMVYVVYRIRHERSRLLIPDGVQVFAAYYFLVWLLVLSLLNSLRLILGTG